MKFATVYGAFAIGCLIATYALHHGRGGDLPVKTTGQVSDGAAAADVAPVSSVDVPTQVEDTNDSTPVSDFDDDLAADASSPDTQDASEDGDASPS